MKFFMFCFVFILVIGAGSLHATCAQTQPPTPAGRWNVEFKFSGDEKHSLRFEARSEGKGAFLLLDVVSSLIPPAEPTKAQWEQAASGQISFSGGIEFPIGNVGRDAGTLVFTGSFESANSIKGKVAFFRADQNPKDPGTVPAKAGDFTAKRVVTSSVTSVSAASYSGSAIASESIVTAFGSNLAMATQAAATLPLPTSMAGTTVLVQTSGGTERFAPLFFVSPTQVNFLVPTGMSAETATIAITSGDGATGLEAKPIVAVAPGLFSANASGRGLASAIALRVNADGGQSYEPVARFDQAQNKFVSVPIDLSPAADQVFLLLFGTGIRGRSAVSAVTASIGGIHSEVLFAGPQVGLAGLDQVNVRLSRSLAGRGEVDIALTADRQPANVVTIHVR